MIQIKVNDQFDIMLNSNHISVVKSNPILKQNQIVYIGSNYTIKKRIIKIQPHWSGKKNVTLQVIQSNKLEENKQTTEQNIGRKKDGKNINSKALGNG